MSLPPPCLLGLPYDASSSYLRGAAEAPALIRRVLASPAGNSWTEGLVDLRGLQDAGDLALPETPESRALIEAGIAKILLRPARPLCLGGDHSVTYPVLRALRGAYPGLAILHIDAHPDLYPDFGGDPYSHACPFARIMEEGLASRLVQVGIRAMTPDQKDQAARFGVEVIDMRAWTSGTRPRLEGPTYISIDMDGLDPAHAPGVSHPEPGGLTVREVLGLIQDVPGPLVGADVVEVNPRCDPSGSTLAVAAKLVKELAGHMLGGPSRG